MEIAQQIQTENLILRVPSITDANRIFDSYAQDEEVSRYLVWQPHQNIEETKAYLDRCEKAWQGKNQFPYAITLKTNGLLVGMIETTIENFKAEVGYVLARDYWGKGIMTEALKEIIKQTLKQEGIYRFWGVCDVDNKASARVLEKAGMKYEGLLHRQMIYPNMSKEPRDCFCYATTK